MTEVRRCKDFDCNMEAMPRRQICYEAWLRKQPPVVRHEAAQHRLSLVPEEMRRPKVHQSKWPPGRRWCAGCQTFVLIEDAAGSACKACASIRAHRSKAKSRFGLTEEDYAWLLETQKGKCAICRQRPKTTRLAIDHDHDCPECGGKDGCKACIRGLICSKCNHEILGGAHDSVIILRQAVAYLERPPMRGEWNIPEWERAEWEAEHGQGAEPPPF